MRDLGNGIIYHIEGGFSMKKRNFLLSGAVVLGLSAFSGTAMAQTDYDLIVPGSPTPDDPAYTDTVTKSTTSGSAQENNSSIGGGNTLNSAIYFGNDQITPTTEISSGGSVTHNYNTGEAIADRDHRLGQETQAVTVVDVQSSGTWSPDN